MNIVRFAPAALAAGLAAFVPLAGSAAPLSLDDAVRYALAHSATVVQARASVASARSSLAKQKGQTYPTVSGSLQNTMQKSSNYGGIYQVIGAQQQSVFSQNTAQIGTQYQLNLGGLGFIQLAQSKAQLLQAQSTLKRSEEQIAASTTSAFYAIAQKKALVSVDESDLAYQRILVANAQAKERAGVSAGVDVLRAQVAEKASQSALVGAKADVLNASETLAQQIGAPIETAFDVPTAIGQPSLPHGSVESLVAIARNDRPDVAAARYALRNATLARKGVDRALFPQVNVNAAFGNQFSPTTVANEQNQIDQAFAQHNQQLIDQGLPPLPLSDKPIVPRGSPGYWQIGASTSFTFPLVDYGARHTERLSDDAAVASAQSALSAAEGQASLDVRQSYRAAQTALAQLQYAKDESRLGIEAARIAQLQYQSGIIALSDVSQAEQTSIKAQSDLINARVSYVTAIVNLRIALGTYNAQDAVADLR